MDVFDDPNCGDCGKPKSEHIGNPSGLYCYADYNGHLFTPEPTDSTLMSFIDSEYPLMYQCMVSLWKLNNGHTTTQEEHEQDRV